jgi:hypothetical protein
MKRVIKASGNEKLRNIIEQVEIYSKMDGYTIEDAINTVADKFYLSDKVIDFLFERFNLHS